MGIESTSILKSPLPGLCSVAPLYGEIANRRAQLPESYAGCLRRLGEKAGAREAGQCIHLEAVDAAVGGQYEIYP